MAKRPLPVTWLDFEVPKTELLVQTRLRALALPGGLLAFSLPDVETAVGAVNLRQLAAKLSREEVSSLPGQRGKFLSVSGVLALLDRIKRPSAAEFRTWFLQHCLDNKSAESYPGFPQGFPQVDDGAAAAAESSATPPSAAPPAKKPKLVLQQQSSSHKGPEMAPEFDVEKLARLVHECRDLYQFLTDQGLDEVRLDFLSQRLASISSSLEQLLNKKLRIVLVGRPDSGKSWLANCLAFRKGSPAFAGADLWGRQPLDTRGRQHRAQGVTRFNLHLEADPSAQQFTVSIETLSEQRYRQHTPAAGPPPVFLGKPLQLNCSNEVWAGRHLAQLDLFLGTLAQMPDTVYSAVRFVRVRGPFEFGPSFEVVDTVGIENSNSLQTQLVREEVAQADVLLVPKKTLLNPDDVCFLDQVGLFSAVMGSLPLVAWAPEQRDKTLEDPRITQAASIYEAEKDPKVLTRFDTLLRLQLLGEVASRVLVVHPQEELVETDQRAAFFHKMREAILARGAQSIIRGACGFLYALLLHAPNKAAPKTLENFKAQAKLFEHRPNFKGAREEKLRLLQYELRQEAHSFLALVDLNLVGSLPSFVTRMIDRTYAASRDVLELQLNHGRMQALASLEAVCGVRMRAGEAQSGLSAEEKMELLNFLITELNRTIERDLQLRDPRKKPLHDQLERHMLSGDAEQFVACLMEAAGAAVDQGDVPGRWLCAFNKLGSSLEQTLRHSDVPGAVVERARALVRDWREYLMQSYQHRNARLDLQKGRLKLRRQGEQDATIDMGPEHGPLLASLAAQVFSHADAPQSAPQAKKGSRRAAKDEAAGLPLEDTLKVTGRRLAPELSKLIRFERNRAEGSVVIVTSPDAHTRLEDISKEMHTVGDLKRPQPLCLAVPTKFFDADDHRLRNKRLDFECFEAGQRKMPHLVMLLVESAQLGAYRAHMREVEKLCQPSELHYIFVEIPDNAAIEVYFESARLIAREFDVPYLARCPDNIENMYEFRLDVVRLCQVAFGRAFVWTQRVVEQIEDLLWKDALELVRKGGRDLQRLLALWSEADAAVALFDLSDKNYKRHGVRPLVEILAALRRNQAKPQDETMKKLTTRLEQELPKHIAALDSFLVVSMRPTAVNIYSHNFNNWPHYLRFLGRHGKAISGPLIFRTDALRALPFCSADDFLKPALLPADLGHTRTRDRRFASDGKWGVRPATWRDIVIATEHRLAKACFKRGLMQLQNFKMTFAPKTKFPQSQDISLMMRRPPAGKEATEDEGIGLPAVLGFALPVMNSVEGDPLLTADELEKRQLRLLPHHAGPDSLLAALQQALDTSRDTAQLQEQVELYVRASWQTLAAEPACASLAASASAAKLWCGQRGKEKTADLAFAIASAFAFGRKLTVYHLNADGELTSSTHGPAAAETEPAAVARLRTAAGTVWAAVEKSSEEDNDEGEGPEDDTPEDLGSESI